MQNKTNIIIWYLLLMLFTFNTFAAKTQMLQGGQVPNGLSKQEWINIQKQLKTNQYKASSGLQQQAYIKASNAEAVDQFGWSVAISGDTLVVGARDESSNTTGVNGNQDNNLASYSGAVYVFGRTAGKWKQEAYLKASNTKTYDQFGWSVAISGNTIAVGAYNEGSNTTGINGDETNNLAGKSGAVYIFTRTTFGLWSQQAYLKASNTGILDQFGYTVSLSGDTLAVGANWEDSRGNGINSDEDDDSLIHSGAVYVFTRNAGTWQQQAYLKASNSDAGDEFGNAVAIADDILVVGARFEQSHATGVDGIEFDNSAEFAGAAYVFIRSGDTWEQQAYLKASNTEAYDHFGHSVSISNDTLAIGAIWESSNATEVNGDESDNSAGYAGAVYVFTRSDNKWQQQAYIKATNTNTHDRFGGSVSISDNILLIGAYGEDSKALGIGGNQNNNSASFAGAAYVFSRREGDWKQETYLKASNTESHDQFGWSVSISEETIVVAAHAEDSNAVGIGGDESNNFAEAAGAVYVFGSTVDLISISSFEDI